MVKFPIVKAKDPFAEEVPAWRKCLYWLLCIAVVVCGLWLGNLLNFGGKGIKSPLKCFNREAPVEEVVVEEPAVMPADIESPTD